MLRRGSYDSLSNMGLENRISSVRPVRGTGATRTSRSRCSTRRYEYRRRPNERLSRAPVTSVRAVVGPPEQRCWVERQQVAEPQREYNVPGAVIGGVLGGILGHQIGGGTGKDIATIGGVVGGAAIGANVNSRTSTQYSTRDVRRCETTAASGPPQYYDVTYEFRGVAASRADGLASGPHRHRQLLQRRAADDLILELQVTTVGRSRPVRPRIPAMRSAAAISGASASCVATSWRSGSGSKRSR